MSDRKKVLLIGAGNMGTTHGMALNQLGCEIVGIVSRGDSKDQLNAKLGGNVPLYTDWQKAINESNSDAVVIASTTITHAPIATYALQRGKHVFTEKPIAETGKEGRKLQTLSKKMNRILNVGYILEYSEGYKKLIEEAHKLGGPFDIHMTLNQRSSGKNWETHKKLIAEAGSPVVDCAPHYISLANQIVGAKPTKVYGSGRRIHSDTAKNAFDSAMIEISYEDGSRFEYRAAWGPFVAPEGFSIKTINTPKGFVQLERENPAIVPPSDHVPAHVNVENIRLGYSKLDVNGAFGLQDKIFSYKTASEHDDLGFRQMRYFLDSIEGRVDSSQHLDRAVWVTELALLGHKSALENKVITILR